MQQTVPQHNFRLDAASLEGKRFGEVSCREYREAIIRTLPHSWTRMSDTHMREAFFAKHRSARELKTPDQGPSKAGGQPTKARAEVQAVMVQQANALVAHAQEGMMVVNLFNGALGPPRPPLGMPRPSQRSARAA